MPVTTVGASFFDVNFKVEFREWSCYKPATASLPW